MICVTISKSKCTRACGLVPRMIPQFVAQDAAEKIRTADPARAEARAR